MSFNQWAAGRDLDGSERLAFEAVWNALVNYGAPVGEASSLLADLFQSLPEPEPYSEEDRW